MSLVPFVSPGVDETGLATTSEITITYPVAIDEGSIESTPPVLVKKTTSETGNKILPHPVAISVVRLNLADDGVFEGKILDPKQVLYRTKIILKPTQPLDQNSAYTVIIPKELALKTISDISLVSGTSPLIQVKGPSSSLRVEQYEVEITEEGSQSRAGYVFRRKRDGFSSINRARSRYIELEDGVSLRFPDGEYKVGTKYSFNSIPRQPLNELFMWSFETGTHQSQTPEDKTSNRVVGLPLSNNILNPTKFAVTRISPEYGACSWDNNSIVIEFNKDLDQQSITDNAIKATLENLLTGLVEKVNFTYSVDKNILTITLIEE
jgi:hypothetical protein